MNPTRRKVITNIAALTAITAFAPQALAQNSNTKTPKLGHIFKASELPKNKKHLEGALYFADNTDGTMRIVSADQGVGSYNSLAQKINALTKAGHSARAGTKTDWSTLLNSAFGEQADINMSGYGRDAKYWQSDQSLNDDKTVATVRNPGRGVWYSKPKTNEAQGRIFTDETPFTLNS